MREYVVPIVALATVIAALSVLACGGPPAAAPAPTTDLRGEPTPEDSETKQVVQPTRPALQPTQTVPVEASPTSVPTVLPDRAASSAALDEGEELVKGNSTFAFDLYRTLSTEDGNLFFSPYSISIALGMTYVGARGETASQMADTLHFPLSQERLHPALNALYLDLDSRGGGKRDNDPSAFQLNIANALWGQRDYRFLDEFTTVVAENYGAGVRPTDFQGQPEESRVRTNDWVAEQTEDKIKDIIPPRKFEGNAPALVLTNAIYFNGAWTYEFDELPKPEDFHPLRGNTVAVPMMKRSTKSGYASGDGYTAVDLRYIHSSMSMTILVPDSGTFEEFEESLDYESASRILESLESREVVLTMPKFEFESEIDLVDTLNIMGMPNAFDDMAADFSGMDGHSCLAGDPKCLFVSDVIHKAFVLVNEEGTEAAAATIMVVTPHSGSGEPPVELAVDRPLIFLIRDSATGTILFFGRVLDPSEYDIRHPFDNAEGDQTLIAPRQSSWTGPARVPGRLESSGSTNVPASSAVGRSPSMGVCRRMGQRKQY